MYLKPQDVVIVLKLALHPGRWSYPGLAHDLGMSQSEVHAGIKRAAQTRLYDTLERRPVTSALLEFLIHGVKYAYAPTIGAVTRGMPTAFATPGLGGDLAYGADQVYVWPDPEGEARGQALSPLYRSVPWAARNDEALYTALGAVDALRVGRARERAHAEKVLRRILAEHGDAHAIW